MTKMNAVLFTDSSCESEKAREALKSAGVKFREWKVTREQVDFAPPLLISKIGEYTGGDVIASYAGAVAKATNGKE
jgi:hypothetical protein